MPTLSGSSIRTGSRSEGSQAAENQASLWTGEELTDQGKSVGQHPATPADRLDAM